MSKSVIPEKPYPTDLNECMVILSKVKYKSIGVGVVWLDYNHMFNHWSVAFRNPQIFTNPHIIADTPIEAVHDMFDFLNTINFPRGNNQNSKT